MGVASRPKNSGGRRPKSKKQYPAKASREYPVQEGHNYLLNGIPENVWQRAKTRAHAQDQSVRVVLIRALELFGSGRLEL